jgi:lipopolysaccharide export system protein LptA
MMLRSAASCSVQHQCWRAILLSMLVLPLGQAPATAQTVDATPLSTAAKEAKEVNIEADRMEVLDEQRRAIFIGNVDAVRGGVKLTSDRLVADYAETAAGDGSKDTEVIHIEATGKVTIVTSRQRITGQWAKMDVKANKVTIGGDVVVTQGQTVLRGRELLVDLERNTSQLTGGRVRGSFVPGQ